MAAALATTLAALAVGCGTQALPRPQPHAYPRPRPSPVGAVMRGRATLSGTGDQALGHAALTLWSHPRRLAVTVNLGGLARFSRYPAAIRMGSCAHPGPVVYGLKPLAAGATARASATTVIAGATGIPTRGWILVVEGPAGGPVACGKIYRMSG